MADSKENKEKVPGIEIEKARAILITEQPFFACLLQACKFSWDERVKTAGVRVNSSGQVELVVSRKFWDGLDGYEGVGLLMHEMLHILNEHLVRGSDYNFRIANLAMDIAINQYIPKGWLPKGALLPEMKNPDGSMLWKFEPKKAFEVYYVELLKIKEQLENEKNGKNGNGNGSGKPGDGQSQGQPGDSLPDTLDNHNYKPEEGESEGKAPANGGVTEEMEKLAYDALINKAISDAKDRFPGSIPLHVERLLPKDLSRQRLIGEGNFGVTLEESNQGRLNQRETSSIVALDFLRPDIERTIPRRLLLLSIALVQ